MTWRVSDNFLTSDGLRVPDNFRNVLIFVDFGVNISRCQNNKTSFIRDIISYWNSVRLWNICIIFFQLFADLNS